MRVVVVQGWLGSRWTNGSLQPLSTTWISEKVLWKVTHASALILTVWISHLIWHITHHLYMYIIIENVSIKKKYLVLFSHHQRSKLSLRVDVNLGDEPWESNFPSHFSRKHKAPYSRSFYTWDFVTVRIRKLNAETQDPTWIFCCDFHLPHIISVSFGEPSRSWARDSHTDVQGHH